MVEMGDAGRMDIGAYQPSLEIPEGDDPDLLQCLLASWWMDPPTSLAFHVETLGPKEAGVVRDHSAKDAGIVSAIGGASPAFGLAASTSTPPTMIPSIELYAEGQIALPLVEHTTRYVVLLIFSLLCLLTLSSCLDFVNLHGAGNPHRSLRS